MQIRLDSLLPSSLLSCSLLFGSVLVVVGCDQSAWNSPYSVREDGAVSKADVAFSGSVMSDSVVRDNVLYSSFGERPKHLDPARSYSSNEYVFTGQIYEPLLSYHYYKRPYELIPLSAESIPTPVYVRGAASSSKVEGAEAQGDFAPSDTDGAIRETVYTVKIRKGLRYQPHPALAVNESGQYLYHQLSTYDTQDKYQLSDFAEVGTREVTAEDFVYQVKRFARPDIQSPILGLMGSYIIGLESLSKALQEWQAKNPDKKIDLRQWSLEGVRALDAHTLEFRISGRYPQFLYWLAMPFFSPIPWEADVFYNQPGLSERSITLDWYPIGSGPFMIGVNNPHRVIELVRNPNYRVDFFPMEGESGDREAGLLADGGKQIPFLDRVVYSLEKESIPYWKKFLQGYYDTSGVSKDTFADAIATGEDGAVDVTPELKEKGIRLLTSLSTSIYYLGFNMLDPVVGGYTEEKCKLRRAISMALDYEEYIAIFLNGRGIPAEGPIPPGIFGARTPGSNGFLYQQKSGRVVRRGLDDAKRLLAEAGYPEGRDAKTGQPLIIHLDITGGGVDDRAQLDWMRKSLDRLGVQLIVRATDYRTFQDKMMKGRAQMFEWGWNADYPDPENFLFLLYGQNGKAEHQGENAANYSSRAFDELFQQLRNMDNTEERRQLIEQALAILDHDSPWVWGFHPKSFGLMHEWLRNSKPNMMAHNGLRYLRIDAQLREKKRQQWNRPVVWPLGFFIGGCFVCLWMARRYYASRQSRLGIDSSNSGRRPES